MTVSDRPLLAIPEMRCSCGRNLVTDELFRSGITYLMIDCPGCGSRWSLSIALRPAESS